MEQFMKRQLAFIFLGCLVLLGCTENGKTGTISDGDKLDADTSYAFGINVGSMLKETSLYPDYNSFLQGVKDILEEKTLRFNEDEAMSKIQTAVTASMEKQSEGSRQAEVAFLAANGTKPGIITTGSGLQYEVISEGTGATPGAEDTVQVNYSGAFIDGTEFDSSYSRGEPTEFPLNGVIPGWSEGIRLMKTGSKYKFYIPSELGYGPQGAGQVIPPYSTLIFEVELLSIVK
jgi:FKBP-type peptidyl-prolyl cis-trans isomerase FkpA